LKLHQALTGLKRFANDSSGLETVEYGVMVALLISGTVGALSLLTGAMTVLFTQVKDLILP
jgi:Flp pilus assembly pilin Flp